MWMREEEGECPGPNSEELSILRGWVMEEKLTKENKEELQQSSNEWEDENLKSEVPKKLGEGFKKEGVTSCVK